MPRIPIKRVFVFDNAGLVTVVKFRENGAYSVLVNWSEELSVKGAKFVALALKKKIEENTEFFEPRKNLMVHLGSKYIVAIEHKKFPRNEARKLLRKVNEILSALRTFDPTEIGEVVARAIKTEFMD